MTGELWIKKFHIWWERLDGEEVKLLSDGIVVDEAITGKDGSFSMIYRAPYTPGVYFLRAKYGGDIWVGGCESDRVPVRVQEEEVPPEPWWKKYKAEIAAGLGGFGLAAVVTGVKEWSTRR